VLNPELGADAQTEQIEFYKKSITDNGGEIINHEPWGKLTLAYKIEKFSEGIYNLIQFKAATEYVAELEKRYKFNENVLRYVVVMIDEKKFKLKPRKDPVKRAYKPKREDQAEESIDAEFMDPAEAEEAADEE
jgi:small subunit ribosomal protein S6